MFEEDLLKNDQKMNKRKTYNNLSEIDSGIHTSY